jgi:hypothetical protein
MAKQQESYILMRWLFLRLLGAIHLSAFGSYAFQILALNGSRGILPTCDVLHEISPDLGWLRFWMYPTVAWFNCSDATLQGITIAGVCLSVLVILGVTTAPSLVLLAILWLSLVTGGGEFTGFQSDGMLVELTVLSLFIVPWQWFEPPWPVPLKWRRQTPPPIFALWLLRFMLFRIMFISGVVKILSGDPYWRDLTALEYHYETQPIPTPLAWYADHFPEWIQKFSALFMFAAELIAPPMMFLGRRLRIAAFVPMFALHAGIALTGNYTFLNFILMLLCLTLIDDGLIKRILPQKLIRAIEESQVEAPHGHWRVRTICFNAAVYAMFLIAGCRIIASMLTKDVLLPLYRVPLDVVQPLHLADSYGLFAVMTISRPEIVFQGSDDGVNWRSYEFKYKPGDDLKRPPPWVEPHMPRLDWRLWFAAMVPVEENLWVLSFVHRLLEGSPEMKIFFVDDPFPDHPPKYIRAFVYDYHFTDWETKSKTGQWWRRDNERMYIPPVMLVDGKLVGVKP